MTSQSQFIVEAGAWFESQPLVSEFRADQHGFAFVVELDGRKTEIQIPYQNLLRMTKLAYQDARRYWGNRDRTTTTLILLWAELVESIDRNDTDFAVLQKPNVWLFMRRKFNLELSIQDHSGEALPLSKGESVGSYLPLKKLLGNGSTSDDSENLAPP